MNYLGYEESFDHERLRPDPPIQTVFRRDRSQASPSIWF